MSSSIYTLYISICIDLNKYVNIYIYMFIYLYIYITIYNYLYLYICIFLCGGPSVMNGGYYINTFLIQLEQHGDKDHQTYDFQGDYLIIWTWSAPAGWAIGCWPWHPYESCFGHLGYKGVCSAPFSNMPPEEGFRATSSTCLFDFRVHEPYLHLTVAS